LLVLAALVHEDVASANGHRDGRDARRLLEQAQDIARREGLVLTAIDAALSSAGIAAYSLGDPQTAVRASLPAVDLALGTNNRRVIGEACRYAAALRNANREFRESLKLANMAARFGRLDVTQEAFLQSLMAQSYYGLHDYGQAKSCADEAVRLASRSRNRRLLGRTLRVSALALHACRNALARERIGDAIDLLERHGGWDSLRNAYRASSIITGDREHARRAAVLQRG
jgi:tetratricopeptide (TPR) repeat protein